MNIKLLSTLAKTHPAIARYLETSIICAVVYVLSSLTGQHDFNIQAFATITLAPVLIALNKYKRDLQK